MNTSPTCRPPLGTPTPQPGHDARIIDSRFVIPYRKSGKNDAEASPFDGF